jgi:poly(3-hydroxybutyrate) depolymerase
MQDLQRRRWLPLLGGMLSLSLVAGACSSTGSTGGTGGSSGLGGATGGTSGSGGLGSGGATQTGGSGSGGAASGGTGSGGKAGAGGGGSGGSSAAGGTAGETGVVAKDAGAGTGGQGAAGTSGNPGTGGGAALDGGAGDASSASGSPVPSAGCGKTPTLKNSPGTTINYNKVASGRQYILSLPDNYDNNHPYRLIISYHWATGSASQVFNCHTEGIDCYTTQSPFFGLKALSNNTTIFIAPDGTGGLWSNTNGQDVTFTDDILKQVEADLCIDTSRIELEGFSMGGAMTNTMICSRPGVFRAAAAHSSGGQPLPTTCQPIPYFASLGSQEAGGQTSTADSFAKFNGCTVETLPKAPSGGHICSNYKGCSDGHPVRWCPFDGGHSPSPKDSGQSTTWMPKEVWTFLSQY